MAENLATAIRLVMAFDEAQGESVKNMDKTLRAEAKQRGADNAVGPAGASSTNFTSVMHNLIGQPLLSMEAGRCKKPCLPAHSLSPQEWSCQTPLVFFRRALSTNASVISIKRDYRSNDTEPKH